MKTGSFLNPCRLCDAVRAAKISVVEALPPSQCSRGFSALIWRNFLLALSNWFAFVRLTHGATVNGTAEGGATALHAACERGNEYLVHLFPRLVL